MATVTKHRQNNDKLYDIHKTKYTFFSRAMMEIMQIFYHHYYPHILMITHILIIQNFAKHFILNIITINITLISIILYYIDNIEYRRNINLSPSHPPPHDSPFFPPHNFYLIGNLHAGWIVCGDAMCSNRKDPLVPEHSAQTAKLHLIHIHSTWVLLLKH